MYRIEGLAEVIVTRLLREYYNDIQDVLAMLMCEEIDVEELEDRLLDLDDEYAKKILKEIK